MKRYYGKTLPFGDSSFDLDKVVNLNVEQTLADYAVLLKQLKKDYNLSDATNPVVAFGGSYGGILAAYMRFKYPNLVQGAIAASAPIYLTSGLMPSTLFFEDVTNVLYFIIHIKFVSGLITHMFWFLRISKRLMVVSLWFVKLSVLWMTRSRKATIIPFRRASNCATRFRTQLVIAICFCGCAMLLLLW